ncbi:MAG TPA: glycerol-3-phosphate responsive antiterminator [Bacilli bacterium]
MPIQDRKVLPAVRHMKDFEKLLATPYEYVVLLDCHINMLSGIVREAKANGKKMLLHADLIHGISNDEYAAEFLCQTIRPAGLISTRANIIAKTKQNGLIAIQRVFLLDTNALEKSYALMERTKPDFIEVLPGLMPHIIGEVSEKTNIPILAGGLIRTVQEVENAVSAGAVAVTTSRKDLWQYFA